MESTNLSELTARPMTQPKKRSTLFNTVFFGGIFWCLSVMLTCFFHCELEAALWIGIAFLWLVTIALGLALIVGAVALFLSERKKGMVALLPLVMTAAFLRVWNFDGGAAWVEQARFEMRRPGYEATLARIQQGKLPNSGTINGQSTDSVMRANKFKGDYSNFDDPNLRAVKKLFGGDMVWATPLGKHWYRCAFT